MATTYSMDEEKKKEYDMNYGDFPRSTADPYQSEAKTQDKKAQSAFIKTEKGTLAKRGSVGARRAENKEDARNRAKQMYKDRLKKKTKQVKIA